MYLRPVDGPYKGKKLWLDDPESGTLRFRVRGWPFGRYVYRNGRLEWLVD